MLAKRIDLDKLLDYITSEVYDAGHGLLSPVPDWVIQAEDLITHLCEQTGLSTEEMGDKFDEARKRTHQ